MKQLRLSAFSDEYAKDFHRQIEGMRNFGIDFVELRHLDGKNVSLLTTDELEEAKTILDAYGVRVSAIGSPLGKIPLDGDLDAHFETAKRVFEAANRMETPLVRIFSFYPPEGRRIGDCRGEVIDAVGTLLEIARTYGVTLCHENEARIYGDTPERCRDLLDAFSGALKCVFDMGNFVLEGVTPYPDAYLLLQPYIAYFHIKDALQAGAIVPPGRGEAQIKEILTAHRAYTEEDFFVSLEPHLQLFSGRNALVGRTFENPYRYESAECAFADAVTKFTELL